MVKGREERTKSTALSEERRKARKVKNSSRRLELLLEKGTERGRSGRFFMFEAARAMEGTRAGSEVTG